MKFVQKSTLFLLAFLILFPTILAKIQTDSNQKKSNNRILSEYPISSIHKLFSKTHMKPKMPKSKKARTRSLQDDEDYYPEIRFENYSRIEHLRNYRKISDDMKFYEDEFSRCINSIPNIDYTQETIDECTGKNFITLTFDLRFVILKIMSKADEKVRKIFLYSCFSPAGSNEEFSIPCDVMQNDVLDLLWSGVDFVNLIKLNEQKYLEYYGQLPEDNFIDIHTQLTSLGEEFFELLDECDAHKEVTILRLKTLIDDRTKLLLEEVGDSHEFVEPAFIQHTIQIDERMTSDHGDKRRFLPINEYEEKYKKQKERKLELDDKKNDHLERRNRIKEVKTIQMKERNGEKSNSIRTLNSCGKYSELSGNNRELSTASADRFEANANLKSRILSKLGGSALSQAQTKFKNIHTPQYLNRNRKGRK